MIPEIQKVTPESSRNIAGRILRTTPVGALHIKVIFPPTHTEHRPVSVPIPPRETSSAVVTNYGKEMHFANITLYGGRAVFYLPRGVERVRKWRSRMFGRFRLLFAAR